MTICEHKWLLLDRNNFLKPYTYLGWETCAGRGTTELIPWWFHDNETAFPRQVNAECYALLFQLNAVYEVHAYERKLTRKFLSFFCDFDRPVLCQPDNALEYAAFSGRGIVRKGQMYSRVPHVVELSVRKLCYRWVAHRNTRLSALLIQKYYEWSHKLVKAMKLQRGPLEHEDLKLKLQSLPHCFQNNQTLWAEN